MRPILVLAAAVLFALSPFFSGRFGGFDPRSFPMPQDDPPIVPAGWAFAIWGPIYLALVAHAAFGLARRRHDPQWAPTRLPLILSLAVGAIWIPVAQASPLWATLLIWIMLGGALAALLASGRRDPWLLRAPIGAYAGWLTAASFVSLALVAAGWGILGPRSAAWAALCGALLAGGAVAFAKPAPLYPAALGWALLGISARNGLSPFGLAAIAGAAFFAGAAIAAATRLRTR